MEKIYYSRCLLPTVCLLSLFLMVSAKPPNIVFILADDYGWNDIGYHGSQIKTPYLDELSSEGVRLDNYYVQPICTPTRSQLMSGRYQIHTGMQHGVIMPCNPTGLPLSDKTLAQKLKEVGYGTHIIGKWHLGMYKEEYMPTQRGFDSHFGYLTGAEDYYTHIWGDYKNYGYRGYDFRDNMTPYNRTYGQYSAHLYVNRTRKIIQEHDKEKPLFLYNAFQSVHDPFEVPEYYTKNYSFIQTESRRNYAGMVTVLDEAVRNITDELKAAGLWENTLIVFSTDNGGYAESHGSNNFPLRGGKYTYFEGGVRGVGFVAGPLVKKYGGISNRQLMHVSDWFPTLITLAGGSLNDTKPDGFDQWQAITTNKDGPRKEILHNIDPMFARSGKSVSDVFDTSVQAAYRYGDWKIMTGAFGFDKWMPVPTYTSSLSDMNATDTDDVKKNVYLFNVVKDPEERQELSDTYPHIVTEMLARLAKWNATAVPVNYPKEDRPNCNPEFRDGFWGPWMSD